MRHRGILAAGDGNFRLNNQVTGCLIPVRRVKGGALSEKPSPLKYLWSAVAMTTFDKRGKSSEAKYAHDQETQFKTGARRNKLLGQWMAEQLGLDGADAEAYAKAVIISDFEKPGDEDVFEKVWGDVQAKGLSLTEEQVRQKMKDLLETAREQVTTEG
jgi:hypothetical protein